MGAFEPLAAEIERAADADGPGARLAALLAKEERPLPVPGTGRTLQRWQALARVAGEDLSLVKLYEAHHDAAAILWELTGKSLPPDSRWGVWCAESPNARLTLVQHGDDVQISGVKAWCSGAAVLTHALVSAWNEAGEPVLAAVDLRQPTVDITSEGWAAVGMAATASVRVRFDSALAVQVGRPHDYVHRFGFWAGACGIAACWWGAAAAIAARVHDTCRDGQPDAHRLAHLGAIDAALGATAALLRESAAVVDGQVWPDFDTLGDEVQGDAAEPLEPVALRLRLAVEEACDTVMRHAGRALGAGPLCQDADFARRMADLPVFLRQSHAERDLAALGERIARQEAHPWRL